MAEEEMGMARVEVDTTMALVGRVGSGKAGSGDGEPCRPYSASVVLDYY